MKMCHMVADTLDELHAMADKIGIRREWFQENSSLPHYDVSLSRRTIAVQFGAIEIDRYRLVELIRKHRKESGLIAQAASTSECDKVKSEKSLK